MRSPAARAALPAAVVLVVLLATLAVASPTALAQESGDGSTTIAIALDADGDAHVTVTRSLSLASAAEVDAFDQMAEEHVSGENPQLSIELFEQAAAGASAVTGRDMAITDVRRTATRENRTGKFALSFTWTNFARVDEDQIVVGDAVRSPGGTWLPRLEAGQELVLTFPEGYAVQSVSRPLQNGAIHVEGPATFQPGNPSAMLAGAPAPWWTQPGPVAAGIVALLLLVAGGGYVYRGRLPPLPGGGQASEEPADGDPAPDVAVEEAGNAADAPLLSDEERVLRLLEAEGGRMKQVDIVEATDWSNAKVSQLLTEMAEAGQIDKLRIGRENLISLPGEGPGGE